MCYMLCVACCVLCIVRNVCISLVLSTCLEMCLGLENFLTWELLILFKRLRAFRRARLKDDKFLLKMTTRDHKF